MFGCQLLNVHIVLLLNVIKIDWRMELDGISLNFVTFEHRVGSMY